MDCKGPCLKHCYYKNSILLFLIGFLLGLILNKRIKLEHFNNSDKYLIVKCNSGLCNRLRVLFSYYLHCKDINKKLIYLWYENDACPGKFSDYFENLNNLIILENENKFNEFCKKNNIKNNIDYVGNNWQKNYSPFEKLIYNDLRFKKNIIDKSNRFINNINKKNYNAVHIRRTDHVSMAKKNNKFTTDDEFFEFIEKSNKNVFVATDCYKMQEKLMDKFGDKIFFYNKINKNIKKNNMRSTTLENAVIDIFLCTKSQEFLGSKFSSFSNAIKNIRKEY